ncbi:hypothetical protein F4825DRAFT_445326 [Nemania diffusa]|nr:hypothetical protein F4825DRAFT_445326 [Nemania diffusa]
MPNPVADSVWRNYELVRPIRLTKSQLIRMGNDPSMVSKFKNKDWGFGDDAYVGDLDVFHQLHCLNTLRQYAYADYYNMTALDASDGNSMMALHVNHCVDILLQEIQCNGNVGFITSQWVENQRYPQPDMYVIFAGLFTANVLRSTAWLRGVMLMQSILISTGKLWPIPPMKL